MEKYLNDYLETLNNALKEAKSNNDFTVCLQIQAKIEVINNVIDVYKTYANKEEPKKEYIKPLDSSSKHKSSSIEDHENLLEVLREFMCDDKDFHIYRGIFL